MYSSPIIPFHKFPAYAYEEYDRRLDLEPVQDTALLFDVNGVVGGPVRFLFDTGNMATNDDGKLAAVLDPLTAARLGYDIQPLRIEHGEVEWFKDLGYIDVGLIGLNEVISVPAITGPVNLFSPFHYTSEYDIHFSRLGISFYTERQQPEIPFFVERSGPVGHMFDMNLLNFSISGVHFNAVFDTGSRNCYMNKSDSLRVGLHYYPKTALNLTNSRHGTNEIGYYAPVTLTGSGTVMRNIFSPLQEGDSNVMSADQYLNDGFQFVLSEAGITFI